MEDEAASKEDLLNVRESGAYKRFALFIDSHVQLRIRHAAFPIKVIADQIASARQEKLADLGMERCRVPLVAEFVNRLVGHRKVELAKPFAPMGVEKVSLNELHTRGKFAEALLGEFMHGRGEIDSHIGEVRGLEQLFGQKARTRAQLEHPAPLAGACSCDDIGKGGKELCPPGPYGHGGLRPLSRLVSAAEIEGNRNIVDHECNLPFEIAGMTRLAEAYLVD